MRWQIRQHCEMRDEILFCAHAVGQGCASLAQRTSTVQCAMHNAVHAAWTHLSGRRRLVSSADDVTTTRLGLFTRGQVIVSVWSVYEVRRPISPEDMRCS